MNDAAKLALFDDLLELAQNRDADLKVLAEENQRLQKMLKVLAWNLECAVRIAKDLPPLDADDEAPEKAKRKGRKA